MASTFYQRAYRIQTLPRSGISAVDPTAATFRGTVSLAYATNSDDGIYVAAEEKGSGTQFESSKQSFKPLKHVDSTYGKTSRLDIST